MSAPERPLLNALQAFVSGPGRSARWHTPGHKGSAPDGAEFLAWAYDVTEVGSLSPSGHGLDPIARSESLMASAFGADRTWYSVQGATLPVTAAMLAAFPLGAEIAVDRNAHRSVLAGLVLGGFRPRWIYPQLVGGAVALPAMPAGQAAAGQVLKGTAGLVLTHPTYDGLTASLAPWVDAAHAANVPVVVDEAHGAHFAGRAGYPRSALDYGADLVVHGVHKTEAALTQTGLLHRQGNRVGNAAVDWWWSMLATSSPSYLLLAALDRLQAERHQPGRTAEWEALSETMRELWGRWQTSGISVLQPWWESRGGVADPAKLTILGDGRAMAESLASRGTVEKVDAVSVTLILSPGQDTALLDDAIRPLARWSGFRPAIRPWPQLAAELPPREAVVRAARWVPWRDAPGRVAATALIPYPPGVPLAIPGEVLTPEVLDWVDEWQSGGAGWVQGVDGSEEGGLWVVDA